MDSERMKTELVMTLATTLLFLGMYWWTSLPEWKREMYLMELRHRLQKLRVGDTLSLGDRLIIEKFRQEFSRWEHARKRDNSMETRDYPEESN